MTIEQVRISPQEISIPEIVFVTEQSIWPHEPGIIFEPEAKGLLTELYQVLQPLLEKGQTLKSFASELGVAKIVKARLTPPRRGWTWLYRPEGILIELADWIPPDEQVEVLAHELSHVALGPLDPHTDCIINLLKEFVTGEQVLF